MIYLIGLICHPPKRMFHRVNTNGNSAPAGLVDRRLSHLLLHDHPYLIAVAAEVPLHQLQFHSMALLLMLNLLWIRALQCRPVILTMYSWRHYNRSDLLTRPLFLPCHEMTRQHTRRPMSPCRSIKVENVSGNQTTVEVAHQGHLLTPDRSPSIPRIDERIGSYLKIDMTNVG